MPDEAEDSSSAGSRGLSLTRRGVLGLGVATVILAAGRQLGAKTGSDASAQAVEAAGAQVHRGDLENLESLRAGAQAADGVIHLAFNHDFTDYTGAAETDRRAIDTLGGVLAGSDRPFVVTSGLAGFALGRTMTEDDAVDPDSPRASEQAALAFTPRGVRVAVLRLPPSVHGEGDHGFVPRLIDIANEKGVAAYPGDGSTIYASEVARELKLLVEQARTKLKDTLVGMAVSKLIGLLGALLSYVWSVL